MMHKAADTDDIEEFDADQKDEIASLHQACQKWAQKFCEELSAKRVNVYPDFPEGFNRRQRDISKALLIIADYVGVLWPSRLRESLVSLLSSQNVQELSPENQLLRAVKRFIAEKNQTDFFWSEPFCIWANSQEERPWSPTEQLTQHKMASMLRQYDIRPKAISYTRAGIETIQRGYRIAQFEEAFRLYTPTTQTD